MKITLNRHNSRMEMTKERITGLDDRPTEIIQPEQLREKKERERINSLGALWDSNKVSTIHIIRAPERDERERIKTYLKE